MKKLDYHATTVIGVVRDGKAALGSDGQMTMGATVMKPTTNKLRKLHGGKILVGFAGGTADGLTLIDRFEEKLQAHSGKLDRAAVELAKDWRMDKLLRRLEAMLAVVSADRTLIISGTGDVIEPEDNIVAIGSGGMFALSAARIMLRHTEADAKTMVLESLKVASEICIYTNANFKIEEL